MKNLTKLYIAYGSNLNLRQMEKRCPTAEVVGKGELKDFELVFRGGRRGAVATVEPKEGSNVPVLIWKIRKKDEDSLDLYEGYPSFYGKKRIDVEADGEKVTGMMYVMQAGYRYGIPSDYYVETIREGYQSAGFAEQTLSDALHQAYSYAYAEETAVGLKIGMNQMT